MKKISKRGLKGSTTPPEVKDSWSTPQYLFDWLDSGLNFDIDLAASVKNYKCTPFFTENDDSLSKDWHIHGHKGFCNPPYSKVAPWITKAVAESSKGFLTALVIPTPNGEKHYSDVFTHASDIIFIHGRISFIDQNGRPKQGNNRGTCVVIFGFNPVFPDAPLRVHHIARDEIIAEYGL